MVSYTDIQASNVLIDGATAPRVAVFVGGTSGIGKATIKALVATGICVRIYLLGRQRSEAQGRAFIQELHTVNPKAEVVWTEAEVSLLADTKRVCEVIRSKETHIDLLMLTTGYAPFGARRETVEGIEIAQSLEYYSRVLFIQHLIPLLNKSERSRVVSVLGGGLERASIYSDDLDLKQPGNFGGVNAQMQYICMNSMTLERLANDNANVTFIHSWPGWVKTGNVKRSWDPNSTMGWFTSLVIEPVIGLFSYSEQDSGQRHLFQITSAAFGGRGVTWKGGSGLNSMNEPSNGLFLVNYKCDCTPNVSAMASLRESSQTKIWSHTQEILQPYV